MSVDTDPILAEIRALVASKRYPEATALAKRQHARLSEAGVSWDAGWAICEKLGDRCRRSDPDGAIQLYELACAGRRTIAGWSTGSGEGLMAMAEIDRLERKILQITNPHPSWLRRLFSRF